MKKCIFYLPYELDSYGAGARMLRPRKMIQAFQMIGYEVFVIEGIASIRKKRIQQLKERIKHGEKYDFLYSESHTEPTLLTEPNHLPTHPLLDFGFFNYIKRQGIKIGLFYCDIYWKFDNYGKELSGWKRRAAIANYKYDIRQYKRYLDKFYVADLKVCDYIKEDVLTNISRELPPGTDNTFVNEKEYSSRDFSEKPINIFYVGGIGSHYKINELFKAVYLYKNSTLTVCCREPEWDTAKEMYQPYLCDRITIIHEKGDELEEYYHKADVCSLLFENDSYMEMAKPFKAFEYLSHGVPAISTKGTAIGRFIEDNDIGWNICFDSSEIMSVFDDIVNNPGGIAKKRENCLSAKDNNLWEVRARTVVDDLVGKR